MASRLVELFEDGGLVERIKRRLPYLFRLAETQVSKGGKVGMEAGTLREQVLIALLIYKFGEENVNAKIGITEPEIDIRLFDFPVSIKAGRQWDVKVSWTVNQIRAREFALSYTPRADMLFALINWEGYGGLYYIPLEASQRVFQRLGREGFLRLPKPGTNPRGIEIRGKAMWEMCQEQDSRNIEIHWEAPEPPAAEIYRRWVELWGEG